MSADDTYPTLLASDVMSDDVALCPWSATARDAALLMRERDCGSVPVVDARGRAIGMVTDRDLCLAALDHDARLEEIPVAKIITRAPVTCAPDAPLETIERMMSKHRVRRVAVVGADETIVGMVSLADIIRARSAQPRFLAGEVVSTLAQIARADDSAVG